MARHRTRLVTHVREVRVILQDGAEMLICFDELVVLPSRHAHRQDLIY